MPNPQISIIIPVFNESQSLAPLHREISDVANEQGYQLEIIFVDDGSIDNSWSEACRIASSDSRVGGIRFSRNFGKSAAIRAGVESSRGELIVTLDADLQDNPAEIPRLLAARLDRGLDLVSGWKQIRRDSIRKRIESKIFNFVVSWMTGVHLRDHNSGLKVVRREIFDQIKLSGGLHRFLPVLAAEHGWRVGEIPVDHRPRRFGKSKYGWSRVPESLMDLFKVAWFKRSIASGNTSQGGDFTVCETSGIIKRFPNSAN